MDYLFTVFWYLSVLYTSIHQQYIDISGIIDYLLMIYWYYRYYGLIINGILVETLRLRALG